MTLNEIALKYETDKSSKLHNYTEKYERHFSHLRERPIKVLEIGIQNGHSLKTWKEFFPQGLIFGIDIVDCRQIDEDRIKTLQGSQIDLAFLQKVNNGYGPFDIIIDDGSHISSDMRISFDFLFPLLRGGGMYVVEDLHCCYWPEFKDTSYDFMDRLKDLLDRVNSRGKAGLAEKKNEPIDHFYRDRRRGEMDWWDKSIDAIHLYRSIVFFEKNEAVTLDQSYSPIKPPLGLIINKRKILNLLPKRK